MKFPVPEHKLIASRYSTLDNVDGKQARRTGTSSGLGELFEFVPPPGYPWESNANGP